MRDVNYGWLIRYIHANGASMFFLAVYIHMFRGLYYGSYKAPREVLWILGCIIYLLMMATAFMGYVLPWGQMSFWGATVITNLFGAIPVVGAADHHLAAGAASRSTTPTLNRFFSLHYLLPFVIAGVVVLHIWALHVPGNNNPTGVDVKSKADTVPFHPYYTVKDGFAIVVFLILFAVFVFFMPERAGPRRQLHPGQPAGDAGAHRAGMVLPAVLRDPARRPGQADLGVLAHVRRDRRASSSLPWLDTSKVRSMRYRPTARLVLLHLRASTCLVLGFCGAHEPDDQVIPGLAAFTAARLPTSTAIVWLSAGSRRSTTSPTSSSSRRSWACARRRCRCRNRISTPVLSHPAAAPAGAAAAPEKKG